MQQNLLKFDGRIIVVSGAAGGGIGTSATRMLAEAGATVVAVSRSQEKINKNIAPLVAQGLSIVPLVAMCRRMKVLLQPWSRCGARKAHSMGLRMSPAVRPARRGCGQPGSPVPTGG